MFPTSKSKIATTYVFLYLDGVARDDIGQSTVSMNKDLLETAFHNFPMIHFQTYMIRITEAPVRKDSCLLEASLFLVLSQGASFAISPYPCSSFFGCNSLEQDCDEAKHSMRKQRQQRNQRYSCYVFRKIC